VKIVADTNILVSAALWGYGQPRRILELAIEGKLKIGVSRALYDEFCSVLTYHKFKTRMRKERATVRDVKAHVSPFLTFIRRTSAPPSACNNVSDNEVLACAIDFKAFRHLSFFRAFEQRIIDDGLTGHLIENAPADRTRHKHELEPPVGEATHQVEIRKWRVLYWIEETKKATISKILVISESRHVASRRGASAELVR